MQKKHKILKIFVSTTLVLVSVFFMTAFLILEPRVKLHGWQDLDENRLANPAHAVIVTDAGNAKLNEPIYDTNRQYVTLDKLNDYTPQAFIAIEDKRFYKHKGIDFIRVGGATLKNLKSGAFKEGGSTISQQLIKNTHLSGEKTIKRKLNEMRLSRALERKYSKTEILEMYLNMLYFGNNVYGIGAAAKTYFQKDVAELSRKESALLAGVINNPAKYNPCKYLDAANTRANLVLKAMLDNGYITKDEYMAAIEEAPTITFNKTAEDSYVGMALNEAAERLGLEKHELYRKGYTVETYCDGNMTDAVQTILNNTAATAGCESGRMIVLENSSGRVLAAAAYGNAAGLRQPGSVLKPILCYTPALEKKLISPITPILDEKTDFGGYAPSNYKGVYHGWISVADALKYSANVPAVKLLDMNGISYAKRFAERTGVQFDKADESLVLAVGGMSRGATLEQLAGAYQCFANDGKYIFPQYVRSIVSPDGKKIYTAQPAETQAVSRETAYLITYMLKSCAQTGTAKRLKGFDNVAAKTGTVGDKSGNTDAYCIAYSPRYTVAVWLGGDKMSNTVSGGSYPTAAANEAFAFLRDDTAFTQPEGVEWVDIDIRELEKNHKVLRAGNDVLPRYKVSVPFARNNIPHFYSTPQSPFWAYNDLLNFDLYGFDIPERRVDEFLMAGNT